MDIVVKTTKNDKGIIIHELADGKTKQYMAVRGGINWPLIHVNLPAYFCIYGEEYSDALRFAPPENRRGRLVFLCEYEAPEIYTGLQTFFTKLTDATALYDCSTLYTVTETSHTEDYRGYAEAFQRFVSEKKAKGHLEEAPWHERPDLGIHHIMAWNAKGRLDIPEDSLIRAQLQTLQALQVKDVPETLSAVNALRFMVCGFEKYRSFPTGDWRKTEKHGSWRI